MGKVECPKCKEKIQDGATKCKHCHSEFDEPLRDPLNQALEAVKAVAFFVSMPIFIGAYFVYGHPFIAALVYSITIGIGIMILLVIPITIYYSYS